MPTIAVCPNGGSASPTSSRAPRRESIDLRREEYVAGRAALVRKIRRYRPPIVAMVGVTVFRAMFPARRDAVTLGMQDEQLGASRVFVLPNPSGRNANYSYAEMLAAYKQLRRCMQDLMR